MLSAASDFGEDSMRSNAVGSSYAATIRRGHHKEERSPGRATATRLLPTRILTVAQRARQPACVQRATRIDDQAPGTHTAHDCGANQISNDERT